MSRRFTEGYHRDGNVIDAETFNNEYDSVKGWINGGLDRTSLEEGAISQGQIIDNAFHNVWMFSDLELSSTLYTSAASQTRFATITYEEYQGDWIEAYSTTLTGLSEGMLHIEFSCWVQMNVLETLNPKWIQFQITWNGLPVAQTGQIYTEWSNPELITDIPITGGNGTMSIRVRYPPKQVTSGVFTVDSSTDPLFLFGGGQLLAIGRWR